MFRPENLLEKTDDIFMNISHAEITIVAFNERTIIYLSVNQMFTGEISQYVFNVPRKLYGFSFRFM